MPGRSIGMTNAVMPLCFGDVGVGAGDQLAPLGELGARAPHLLAVDDPLVAVALGAAAERGEVRAGAGLGEQLAAQLASGEEARDQRRPAARRSRRRGWSARSARS